MRCALRLSVVVLAGPLALVACGDADEDAIVSMTGAPGYAQLHAQVFVPGCATGPCHSGSRGVAGLSFDDLDESYRQLIEGMSTLDPSLRRVEPGVPEQSLLWTKLSATDAALAAAGLGSPMPLAGVERPSPETLAHIEAWIRAGAPLDGAPFEATFVAPNEGYLQCDAVEAEALEACLDPPAADTTLRLQSQPILVPAGSEVVVCSEVATLDTPLLIRATQSRQMVGGHHLALFTAVVPQGTVDNVDCLEDMTNYRYVTAADTKGDRVSLPAPQALRVEAGETLVLQSHYINTGTEARWVMDSMDLFAAGPDEDVLVTDSLILNTTAIDVPADGEEHELVKTCTLEHALRIEQVTGHTHEYGVWFELEAVPAEGPPISLFQSTDGPVLRDFAGFYPAGVDLEAGDALRITCRWRNPTDDPLRFPREMCAGVTYYTPGIGALLCDTHDETPRPWADVVPSSPPAGEGCVGPEAMGNSMGVGRYCTPGGSECADAEANFCLAAFNPSANYCSVIFCEDDAQCGEGASCVSGDGGTACVPEMCR